LFAVHQDNQKFSSNNPSSAVKMLIFLKTYKHLLVTGGVVSYQVASFTVLYGQKYMFTTNAA